MPALLTVLAVPACVPVYERRLAAYRADGDLSAAADLLADAAARDAGNPDIIREAAVLAFERGATEEAIAGLEKSLALVPDDVRGEVYLAAAYEKSGRFSEAAAHYRRAAALSGGDRGGANPGGANPGVAAAIACQRGLVESRHLDDLVAARLAAERAGTLAPGERILFLPFSVYGTNPEAMSVRLGLAAVASVDWRATPEAVPFAEVDALLAALGVPPERMIDEETRERLARLTGARYIVAGQISELRELVSVAPVLIDRGAPAGDAAARELPLAYQQERIGALVALEEELLLHVAAALAIELPAAEATAARRFSARSGQAIALYGEAILLERSGDPAAAAERLAAATALDPEFALARDADLRLSSCRGTAGDPAALLGAYEAARATARGDERERALLAGTTETVGRVGGAEGEGDDYSVNRAGAAGSALFPVRLPR